MGHQFGGPEDAIDNSAMVMGWFPVLVAATKFDFRPLLIVKSALLPSSRRFFTRLLLTPISWVCRHAPYANHLDTHSLA